MSGHDESFSRGGQNGGTRKSRALPVAGRTPEVLAVREEGDYIARFFAKRGDGVGTEIASRDLAAKSFSRTDETLERVTWLGAINDPCGFLTAIL